MEALQARHLTSHSRTQLTGRVTVYVETSVESVKSWEVITYQQLTTRDCGRLGEI